MHHMVARRWFALTSDYNIEAALHCILPGNVLISNSSATLPWYANCECRYSVALRNFKMQLPHLATHKKRKERNGPIIHKDALIALMHVRALDRIICSLLQEGILTVYIYMYMEWHQACHSVCIHFNTCRRYCIME